MIRGFTVPRLPQGIWGRGEKSPLSPNFPPSKVSSLNCLLAFPDTVKALQEPGDHQDAKWEDSRRDRW